MLWGVGFGKFARNNPIIMVHSSTYLRRAAIGYFIAGLGFLAFGFPFWFLNAVDEAPKGRLILPFLFLLDEPLAGLLKNWIPFVSEVGMLIAGLSLWRVGEPTGLGSRRAFLFVPIAGAVSYLIAGIMPLPFAPLGAFLNGLGMILVGVASLKANIWAGWKRYAPLIVGLFPFLFMFPLLILTGARPAAMIGLWGFPWMALGLAAWQRSKEIKSLPTSYANDVAL